MPSWNVLLTCEDYLPSIGGAEICVANIKNEFERLGHGVTVFTNTTATLADLQEETSIVRIAWRFRPVQLWRNVAILWRLIGKCDLVHCQYSYRLAAICAVLCKLRSTPMVLTQQGRGIVREVNARLHHRIFFWIAQVVSMRGAKIITSTCDEITDLTAAFVPREKIIPITNGYDARMFRSDADCAIPPEYAQVSQKKIILTVRRLVPKNGIHILVQALALVKKEFPDFHYFAIGKGRANTLIQELIVTLDLSDNVTLLGVKENSSVVAYYRHADLVVVPSSAEATSIACIEAMGMGIPLIASRVGGLIDLLGPNSTYGLLVDIYGSEMCNYGPPDYLPQEKLQPLADAIVDCLLHPTLFQERAKRAQTHAQSEYSWESIAKRYLDLYTRYVPHVPPQS